MASSLTTPKKANPPLSQLTSSASKVRVIVRVRPFLPHEIAAAENGAPVSCASVVDQDSESSEEVVVHLNDQVSRECYKLDSFLGPHDNNVSLIFYREVSPLIPGIFRGCNATVFAYGATGSGKTHTMQGTDELPGLMPLTMSAILTMCWNTSSTAEISYYEVYLDRCYDLLEPKAKEITILDDKDGQIHLKGLSRVPISSMSEFSEVFSCGIQRRKVAHTGLNDVSSRSHGVLVISVSTPCPGATGAVVTGKLNLIDLAGNEDNRRTCNEGIRLLESAKINQSLFALSNVIYALNNNQTRIPYRESKLTRILQDSLGGTSRALMVACLNPGEYQESVHTVSLAARSRHISNSISSAQKQETPNVKVDMEAKLRAWLESKGKTKTAVRMGAFGSPLMSKAPSSLSKQSACHSSTKAKALTNRGASNAKERVLPPHHKKLFSNGVSVDSDTEILKMVFQDDLLLDYFTYGCLRNSAVALLNSCNSFNFDAENQIEEVVKAGGVGSVREAKTILSDDSSANVKNMSSIMKSANFIGSSPISEKFKALRGAPRTALSPVNSNDNRKSLDDLSSEGQVCTAQFEPKTPKTPPFNAICSNDNSQTVDTPLDKFNARTSNLKSSLIQEYIDFLNTASIEELLKLKGIGQRRAEYILELRETSPLKSLSDLEKIGLSSKQAYNVFGRAAKGIFD